MTTLSTTGSRQSQHLVKLLISEIPVRVSEETLLKYWKGTVRGNVRNEHNTTNAIPLQVEKQLLLDQQVNPLKITPALVGLTAGNGDDGMISTKFLLDEHGDRITEENKLELLKAAAGNERQGKATCGLLFARYDETQLRVNEEVVQIAAQNEDSGFEILKLLAVRCQNRMPITENIIEAAARIESNGLERLELLLQQQESPVAITTKIIEAATGNKTNWARMVTFLWNNGQIEFNLGWAASKGYDDVVKLFLDTEDVDVNSPDEDGCTPLFRAVNAGKESTVGLLLSDRRVDVNLANKSGQRPLLEAVGNGQEKIVGRLLDDKRVDVNLPNSLGTAPLVLAARDGKARITSLLLSANEIDVNRSGLPESGTALFWASSKGHRGVVEQLLQRDDTEVDLPDKTRGQTPLSVAAENEHETIVTLLLEARVDVDLADYSGWTPLAYAVMKNQGELITGKLLEADADAERVNVKRGVFGWTPFIWAARSGREGIVKRLLATGKVDIHIRDNSGCTAFLWAARQGEEGTLRLLLNMAQMEEEDINSRDKDGRTPFWWAMNEGHTEIMKLLWETGKLDENIRDNNGQIPPFSERGGLW